MCYAEDSFINLILISAPNSYKTTSRKQIRSVPQNSLRSFGVSSLWISLPVLSKITLDHYITKSALSKFLEFIFPALYASVIPRNLYTLFYPLLWRSAWLFLMSNLSKPFFFSYLIYYIQELFLAWFTWKFQRFTRPGTLNFCI